jgi:hypothetical protein
LQLLGTPACELRPRVQPAPPFLEDPAMRRVAAHCALLIPVLALAPVTLGADNAKPNEVTKAGTAPLECIISAGPTCVAGEAPKIVVSLKNKTDKDILLVSQLDGSDCKGRYPYCTFEVKRPPNVRQAMVARCGNVNGLLEANFVSVPKGGTFNPYEHGWDGAPRPNKEIFATSTELNGKDFSTPGVYKIRFVYSTKSEDMKQWNPGLALLGGDPNAKNPKLEALLARVPKTEVVSNEIEITVVEPKK